jgi:threonine aldolase
MDGARLWESAPYYGRTYAEVAVLFDSVYVSFYKGIGGISGAALAGTQEFIKEARVWQVRHGGRPFTLFPYILAARAGLRHRIDRFPQYHARALEVAAILGAVPGILVKPSLPQTHMMHVYLRGSVEALSAANVDIARETRVQLARSFSSTELPDYSKFELSIGDASEALSNEEIDQMFRLLMGAAGSGEW